MVIADIIIIIIIIIICIVVSFLWSFLPGTSLEPAVIPTAQASSYYYYYYYYYYYSTVLECNAELRLLNGLLSALFFDPSFQFLILHFLISLCTHFNRLFIRRGYRGHLENL
jgi:hypothetical protein